MSAWTAHAARFWKWFLEQDSGWMIIKSSTKIGKNVLHNVIKFWVTFSSKCSGNGSFSVFSHTQQIIWQVESHLQFPTTLSLPYIRELGKRCLPWKWHLETLGSLEVCGWGAWLFLLMPIILACPQREREDRQHHRWPNPQSSAVWRGNKSASVGTLKFTPPSSNNTLAVRNEDNSMGDGDGEQGLKAKLEQLLKVAFLYYKLLR